MSFMGSCCKLSGWLNKLCDTLTPVVDLFLRIWVARVFFLAGLTKIQTWGTTVSLFTHEYSVPLLPPAWAAGLGTGIELVFPVMLVLGLGGRFPALILFLFNIMAVVSYPYLLTEAGSIGLNDHFYWGVLLLVILFYGVRQISLDHLICKHFCKK